MSHTLKQIKNWGHREGTKGMHFNYIATGTKHPEIYDFKSDQACEIFERLTSLHALKTKESLPRPLYKASSAVQTYAFMPEETKRSPNAEASTSFLQETDQENAGKKSSQEASSNPITANSTADESEGHRAKARGVRQLDKIRWSIMMEEPVELVDGEAEHVTGDQPSKHGLLQLSPRGKKSWQDITKGLKKFDFQSEKAKEIREQRERREKEERRKDKCDDSPSLKPSKKSLR